MKIALERVKEERAMKEDAFDDVQFPFDYKRELAKARHALDEKVREYATRSERTGYRDLAKLFNLSPGTLCKIAKGCKPACRPGPRSEQKKNAVEKMIKMIRRNARRDAR